MTRHPGVPPVPGPCADRNRATGCHPGTLPAKVERGFIAAFFSGRHPVAGQFCATLSSRRVRTGGGIEAGDFTRRVVRHELRDAARRVLVRAV